MYDSFYRKEEVIMIEQLVQDISEWGDDLFSLVSFVDGREQ